MSSSWQDAGYYEYARQNCNTEKYTVFHIHERIANGTPSHPCVYCGDLTVMIAYAITEDDDGNWNEDTLFQFNETHPTICGCCSYKLYMKALDQGSPRDTIGKLWKSTLKTWEKIWDTSDKLDIPRHKLK